LRDEVAGGRRKLHNEELCDLYSLPDVIRIVKWRMRWAFSMNGGGVMGKPTLGGP
jgi:hypothetical protein